MGTFSLVDNNVNFRLPIINSGVSPRLLAWNRCVPLDQCTHLLSLQLNSKRQRCDIQQQQISHCFSTSQVFPTTLTTSGKDESLHSCTMSHGLIGMDRFAKFNASVEHAVQRSLEAGDTSGSTNKDNIGNILDGT
mmetsp:Transcript_13245/g.28722  ORF Transcript_13245/g.28722 Transcript_13245/m.28722 type:complete len:135 (+) Transcript_13245:522-926(+)